jgi:hypothetical protein
MWFAQDRGVASITRIQVQEDATLKDWLPTTFEEEQDLAHKILQARWKRQESL